MLTTLSLGVLASIAAEIVVWLNKKLTSTVLKGKAAFLLATVVALVGAGFKVAYTGIPVTDWVSLGTAFAKVWTVAQLFFVLIVETLKLDVK